MALLVIVKGPKAGQQFALRPGFTVLGRQADSDICLEARAVSRHHARLWMHGDTFYVEDLDSSNGTFLNGQRVSGRVPVTERDVIQIGPYDLALRITAKPPSEDAEQVVREQLSVSSTNTRLFDLEPARKLQVVLEIGQHLARTLDLDALLDKLLVHLMRLFPQAERGTVLLCDGDRLMVRAQQARGARRATPHAYSRTIVNQALQDGVGLLSEDVRADDRFSSSNTLRSLEVRSLLCVPLIGSDGRRLGVIQLDSCRLDQPFRAEDLHLLTTIGLQVAVVLENAALHEELLREERLRQELTLARDIQRGFLPTEFPTADEGYELFANVYPARQVSGDLYDFLRLADGRLAFFVGDVSGKGMPAALFMVAVRTLSRHLAAAGTSPAETLRELNTALAADNPSGMFVTLLHGIYQPRRGEVTLASAGHPPPLFRRVNGTVQLVELQSGRLLGLEGGDLRLRDTSLTLQPGDTLFAFTDGLTEARASASDEHFGLERLSRLLGGLRPGLPLPAWVDEVRLALERFTNTTDLQDDVTLLALRRAL